ncbi:AAA family ATPase [Pseudomonas sp. PDM16]|uniref:AAA family ATPase n=1 Tax=Pseudomonas sp. PDM16 TaxID=2769292 RepID=UPI00177BA7A5|nr:AAA family ATPase [Pseudomonas sp. PDM16]MBD9415893.1 AAA family ATPase [Pseudomonas sp. PDM16]
MRIASINVTNFQGLRNAALVVSEPVLLVSGGNGAGKSSLLDAISMAFTGTPRRVKLKKDMAQLVTEGQKKGEAHVAWVDEANEEQASWVMLPKGNTAPLLDAPYLPFVLDAQRFTSIDSKERRRALFDLAGATASPNEVAKRLLERGADATLVEKIKPMMRAGFPAAVDQAKNYASEERGAWKSITGEVYGSEKAENWEPDAVQVSVTQEQIDEAKERVDALQNDLDEANQLLGAHKAHAQAAEQRQQSLDQLKVTAGLLSRRREKLAADQARVDEWTPKVAEAERAASGEPAHDPLACPHCQGLVELRDGAVVAYVPPELIADPEAGKRLQEYSGYLESAQRAVINSQRDVTDSEQAATRVAEMEADAASLPSPEAIANAEETIASIRQERDSANAAYQALQDALALSTGREELIKKAAAHHALVNAWDQIAKALAPDGIPGDILKEALTPINSMLSSMSESAKWSQVTVTDDGEITYGGRQYGLLSESEQWRCDALSAVAIARLSGLRLVALDRFDVLQPSARPQILMLLRNLARAGEIDSAILAGTMAAAMSKVPEGIQQVWVEGGQIAAPVAAAA